MAEQAAFEKFLNLMNYLEEAQEFDNNHHRYLSTQLFKFEVMEEDEDILDYFDTNIIYVNRAKAKFETYRNQFKDFKKVSGYCNKRIQSMQTLLNMLEKFKQEYIEMIAHSKKG